MRPETAEILALLDSYVMPDTEDISKKIADDFRNRRIEKNLTRKDISEKSGVAVSNIARFEQKGLISLSNLIDLAMALGYLAEIKNVFSEPKYSTVDELVEIRHNRGRKKSYPKIRKQ